MKAKLDKIKNRENEHEFQEAVADFEERFNFGYMDFTPSFTDRDDLIKKVAHHFIYLQQFEELQDFLKGTQMMPDSCSLHKSYAQLV